MKNIHPLGAVRRKTQRTADPPKSRCVFCLEEEHVAGRNHDPFLVFPDICQKHHDQVTEARRDADISMIFERNRVKRVALALKSVSVLLRMLGDAMWRWAKLLEDPRDPDSDWILEAWHWLLEGEVAAPRPTPKWFSLPAMMRMSVSTPAVLGVLKGFAPTL